MRSLSFFVCLTLITPLFSFADDTTAVKSHPYFSSAIVFSFYKPKVTSSFDYKNQEYKRDGLNAMLGLEVLADEISDEIFVSGFSIFFGGGVLGQDIGEFIAGIDIKKLFLFYKDRIAIPISLDFAWRWQGAYIKNIPFATFIDNPKFLLELEDYKKVSITRNNFDIMPSIDLQFFLDDRVSSFLGDRVSIYVGYMYRITFSGDWGATYYKDTFKVPEEFNPMKNSKERIFGIPGTLRFGMKFYEVLGRKE